MVVAVSGGVDTRLAGVVIRSRDPSRALTASAVLFLAACIFYRADAVRLLDAAGAFLRRHAVAIALMASAALAAHGMIFGSFSVGGSDAYGYVNQAYDWFEGRLPRPIALPLALPFEMSDQMQIPL